MYFNLERLVPEFDRKMLKALLSVPLGDLGKRLDEADASRMLTAFSFMDYVARLVPDSPGGKAAKVHLRGEPGFLFTMTTVQCSFSGTQQNPPMISVKDTVSGKDMWAGSPDFPSFRPANSFAGPGAESGLRRPTTDGGHCWYPFGENAEIDVRAVLHPSDTLASRKVTVVLSGWKLNMQAVGL
jgi:hypothetical protein